MLTLINIIHTSCLCLHGFASLCIILKNEKKNSKIIHRKMLPPDIETKNITNIVFYLSKCQIFMIDNKMSKNNIFINKHV